VNNKEGELEVFSFLLSLMLSSISIFHLLKKGKKFIARGMLLIVKLMFDVKLQQSLNKAKSCESLKQHIDVERDKNY
jgi:hypothetical protein